MKSCHVAVSRLFWSGLGLPGCMRAATFKLEIMWQRDRTQRFGNGHSTDRGRFSGPATILDAFLAILVDLGPEALSET